MAATHHLDISLTLDDIAWHFLNFGEPNHVHETEAGLRELGLEELANVFHEAYELVGPYIPEMCGSGSDLYERLEKDGKGERVDQLRRATDHLEENADKKVGDSLLYGAWVRYARKYPERVFPAH